MRRGRVLLFVLLAAGITAVALRGPIARQALEAFLHQQGFADASVGEVAIGLNALRIEGLDLGPGRETGFGSLQGTWSWRGLIRGRLEALEIAGLEVQADLTPDGVRVAGMELTGDGGDAAPLRLPVPRRIRLEDGRITADIEGGEVSAGIDLEATIGDRLADVRIDRLMIAAETDGVSHGPLKSGPISARLAMQGPLRDASGTLALEAPDRLVLDEAVVENLDLQLPLALRASRRELRVDLSNPGSLTIGHVEAAGLGGGPVRGTIEAVADVPFARVSESEGWSAASVLDLQPLALRIDGGGAPASLDLAPGRLTLEARGTQAAWRAHLTVEGGALAYPARRLRAEGITADLDLASDALAGPLSFQIDRLRSTTEPALFAPLHAQGSFFQASETIVAYEGRIEGAAGGVLSYAGDADVAAGTARAFLGAEPLRFVPKGLQPAALVPLLRDQVEDVSGLVEVQGEIAYAREELRPDVSILLDDLAFTAQSARIEGLSGVIVVDQLVPPGARSAPELRLRQADIGVPLSRGRLVFDSSPDGNVEVETLSFTLARGQIEVRPFTLSSSSMRFETEVAAKHLDLADLLAALEIEGLSGEGTLRGTLPVKGREGAVAIRDGVLESVGRGVLRYRPGGAPPALESGGAGAGLLLQALENFRYDALRITLDGRTDGDLDADLHLEGANPDLYDGYPIEFNLSLEGPLAALARQGVASWTLPERIRRQIERQGAP